MNRGRPTDDDGRPTRRVTRATLRRHNLNGDELNHDIVVNPYPLRGRRLRQPQQPPRPNVHQGQQQGQQQGQNQRHLPAFPGYELIPVRTVRQPARVNEQREHRDNYHP